MEEIIKEIKLIKQQLEVQRIEIKENNRKISELQEERISYFNNDDIRSRGLGSSNNNFENDSVPSSSRVIGNEIALSQFSTSIGGLSIIV